MDAKTFLSLYIFLISALPAMSVNALVRGRVLDAVSGEQMSFANVGAYDGSGTLKHVCVSDAEGQFRLEVKKEATYTVTVSFVGYKTWRAEVECRGAEVELGDIKLEPGTEALEGAKVSAKPLVKRESDRIVLDVSADPDAANMSMSAIMSKIPGLGESAKNGRLKYENTEISGILVDKVNNPMINGDRQYPMRFIKADHMSKVELILPGSPEYGNIAPMLVISLKKALPYGFASEITAKGSTHQEGTGIPDIVINTPFVGIGLRYNYAYSGRPALRDETLRTFTATAGSRTISTNSRSESHGHDVRMDLFRSFLNNKLMLSASLSGRIDDRWKWSDAATTLIDASATETSESTRSLAHDRSPFKLGGGLSASYRWGTGQTAVLNYTARRSERDTWNRHLLDGSPTPETDRGNSFSNEHNFSAALSLNKKLKTITLNNSASAGYMLREYGQAMDYASGTSTGMDYRQSVAYIRDNIGLRVSRNFSTSLDLHLEDVTTTGNNLADASPLDYHELTFIPRLNTSAKLGKSTIGTAFSISSRRPSADKLSPYTDNSDPYNLVTGNPDLRSEITYRAQASYTVTLGKILRSMNWSAYYAVTPGAIERIYSIDTDNVSTYTYANLGNRQTAGLRGTLFLKPDKKSTVFIVPACNYNRYSLPDGSTNGVWDWSLAVGPEIMLWKHFISPSLAIATYNGAVQAQNTGIDTDLSIGISRYIEKSHFRYSITLGDLLHSRSMRPYITAGSGFVQTISRQRYGRYIAIDLQYSFGKFKEHQGVKHESYDM